VQSVSSFATQVARARIPKAAQLGIAAFVVLAIMMIGRIGAFAWPYPYNPDEAEVLAEGRLAAANLWPIHGSYATPTHLALWPISLGILSKLGIPLVMSTAHVLSAFAYSFMSFVGWYLLSKRYGWLRSAILVLPTTVVLADTSNTDLLSLGTELVSCILITGALLLLFGPSSRPGIWRLGGVGFLAGAAIWAKLQVGFLSLAVVIVAAGWVFLHDENPPSRVWDRIVNRSTIALVVGLVLPAVLFVLLVAAGGSWHDFMRDPVDFTLSYARERGPTPLSVKTQGVLDLVLRQPGAILWAVAGLVNWGHRNDYRWTRPVLAPLMWATPLIAGVITLFFSYPIFDHYGNFLLMAGLMAGVVGTMFRQPVLAEAEATAETALTPRHPARTAATWVIALFCVGLTFSMGENSIRNWDFTTSRPTADATLTSLCPKKSAVYVWGWASEMYAYQDWLPGTRYVDYEYFLQIPGANDSRYVKEATAELTSRPPTCVVQALTPPYFAPFPQTVTDVLPGVAPLLKRCYTEKDVTPVTGGTLQVYRRTRACPAT
jgi:hypothetical protein